MRHKAKIKEEAMGNVAKDQCHHYWVIEIANGPKSRGVCQYCGETRNFLNSIPASNPMKRHKNPLDLPEMPEVEIDGDSKS
jgi:hypothetical protein